MGNLFTLIMVAFGLLQILLLVKIWVMTNDVKAMKKHFMTVSETGLKKAKILLLKGKKDEAKKIYEDLFFGELFDIVRKEYTYEHQYQAIKEKYAEYCDHIDFEKYDTLEKFRSF